MTGAKRAIRLGIIAVFLAAVPGLAPAKPPAARPGAARPECQAAGALVPYCGISAPEDLEPVAGSASVIASDMHLKMGAAGIEPQPGVLKRVDLRTGAVTPLYPAPSVQLGKADWGDPACPGEIGAALLPHGIHLSQRRDGAWQLLAVNHGTRESVEFFELTKRQDRWSLRWRGCVVAPASSHLNDVAALPGGGFVVTTMHMGDNSETRNAAIKAAKGENTGFLWRWTPGQAMTRQSGSDAPMPNGVQVDKAGRYAFIATASKGGDVRKLDLVTGTVVGSAAIPNPDNASWAADGRLLLAGVAAGAKPMGCFAKPEAACPAASDVYALDPGTMMATRLFEHAGPPLNAATVAVQAGSDLLIGSCFGDSFVAIRDFFARHRSVAEQDRKPVARKMAEQVQRSDL